MNNMNHHGINGGGMMMTTPPSSSHNTMTHVMMTPPISPPPSPSLQANNTMMAHLMMPPPPSSSDNATMAHHHRKMMMHMTFYWGKDAEILFAGWPGTHTTMYVLSIFFVFLLALVVEWLSYSHLVTAVTNAVVSGLLLTLLHAIRMGLGYLIMLAIMSFNGGIFLAAIAGHAIGFMVFGARVFGPGNKGFEDPDQNASDLPSMGC